MTVSRSRPMAAQNTALAILAAALLASTAVHAAEIGKVESVDGSARIDGSATGPGMAVESGDVVETGADGRVGLRFRDDTTLTVGPGSKVVLDRFVFDPAAGNAAFIANVARGSFAYVSGQVAKLRPEAVAVRTPVATIGIRGTHFAGRIEEVTVDGRPVLDLSYPRPMWPPENGVPPTALKGPVAARATATEPRATFVLLRNPGDGKVGKISVGNDAGTTELNREREAAEAGASAAPRNAGILSAETVDKLFGVVLNKEEPPRDATRLYFPSGSSQLTADSRRAVAALAADVKRLGGREVVVIGHTDTVASANYNRTLSRARAETVKAALVKAGIPLAMIRIEYFGFAKPLVPTQPGVSEMRNRRVEIDLR